MRQQRIVRSLLALIAGSHAFPHAASVASASLDVEISRTNISSRNDRPAGLPATAYHGSAFANFLDLPMTAGNPAVEHAPVFIYSRTGFTYDPCYPEFATVNAETPNPGTCALNFGCPGGNPGESCRDPREDGQYNGSYTLGDSFPVYATVCFYGDAPANEGGPQYRINFGVYYVHDGALSAGHRHDWESITVIFGKVPGFEDPRYDWWTPTGAIYNQHSVHHYYRWDQLETVNIDTSGSTDVAERAIGMNRRHPKVYVGFFSHAAHAHRCVPEDSVLCVLVNTGAPNGNHEYRGDDWWRLPRAIDIHHGREIKASFDYGKATGTPLNNQRDMCTGNWHLKDGPGQL